MSGARHTPGPWEIDGRPGSGRQITTGAASDEPYLIACPGSGGAMSWTETVCELRWSGTPEWEANARLIAAAPELLEALKCLRKAVMDHGAMNGREFDGLGIQVNAAIAKAEGRE